MRLHAVGSLAIATLIGERRTIGKANAQDFNFSDVTVVVPSLDARLGVRVSRQVLYFSWSGEIGYRIDHYWNAIEIINGSNFITLNRQNSSFGFAGPYASIFLGF